MAPIWLILALLCTFYSPGESSHFRGAIIMYRTLEDLTEDLARENGVRVLVIYRIGWRRSYSIGTYCDQTIISNGTKLLSEGRAALDCRVGCTGSLADMTFYCTDFSDTEDWSFGENTNEVLLRYEGDGIVQASFTSSAWISLVRGGGRWELRLSMNLTRIITERGGNVSPVSKMAPIIRLQYGCNHTVEIPVEDADGDNIRCRWASSSQGECGGVCDTFPGAVLDERTCELHYTAEGITGFYAVALQIEDFLDQVDTVPFSSVPIQFLVYVYRSTESCYNKPEFISPPTRPDDSCIGVATNDTLNEKLVAMAGGPGISIMDIGTQSPPGLRKSELDLYSSNQWYVDITWTPTVAQQGPNLFCYVATDNTQRTSDQVCVTILGGVTPPRVISGSMFPKGKIHPAHSHWQIEFDRNIFRPKRASVIRFYDDINREVYKVDTATSPLAIFPDPQVSNILEFQTEFRFLEKARYYVTLDNGVAVGKEFCGPESIKETSKQFWQLLIRDVTPPQISFKLNPAYTNANTTITWSFDEEATTVCVLQSPGQGARPVVCNQSFTGKDLAEGFHNLFIQASDNESNSAQYQHRWYVDRSKPTAIISNPPKAFSNKTDYTFLFRCIDRSSCVYKCRSHHVDDTATYSDCSSIFKVNDLQEVEYVLSVYAIDSVGNIGSEVTVRWQIDVQAPHIQGLSNKTVMCGDPITPTTLGYPEVTDNMDTDPDVEYTDIATSGCMTKREWVAIDMAGNNASHTQFISFSNTVSPSVVGDSPLFVACGNTDDVLFNTEKVHAALNITHLCDRDVNVTFVDSREVDACGIELTRSWTITDDCGKTTLFNQDIRVLKQSYPEKPQNGEVNVDINSELVWPQYPGAIRYNVYIWQYGTNELTTEIVTVTDDRIYLPIEQYPPNTHMLWRIGYVVVSDGITTEVPSPNWGFLTKSFPDLSVTDVQIPEAAFSGSAFTMSWRVENLGNISTVASSRAWYDGIFLSSKSNDTPRQWTKVIIQRRFVDAQDGYIAEADIQLRDGEIGNLFVSVSTDIYRNIRDDFDRTNNIRQISTPLKVELTPPPNLEISSVIALESSFSGQQTIIRWVVINTGIGITQVDKWIDAVFLSVDEELDSNDQQLYDFTHNGALISQAEYETHAVVTIPNAIYGVFNVIVQTDVQRDVYEHANENDNTNTARLEVILSPTPDFVVTSLDITGSVTTGDKFSMKYTVTNNGAGMPFEDWWTDTVMLVSQADGMIYYNEKKTFTHVMSPGVSYSHTFTYQVSPDLPSGEYNVTILTDDGNRIFEFDADNNNGKWKVFSVLQTLPNFEITNSVSNIIENTTGSYLTVDIIVKNSGLGKIAGISSEDALFVSAVRLGSPEMITPIISITRRNDLDESATYKIELPNGIELPQVYTGELNLYILLDRTRLVVESNENDNFIALGSIYVSKRSADLVVTSVNISTDSAIAGTNLTVTWTVSNTGNLASKSTEWVDSVYLSRHNSLSNSLILHKVDIKLDTSFQPGMEYSQSADVYLPITITGFMNMLFVTGQRQNGYEEKQENNVYSTSIEVRSPPTPDIFIQNVVHEFLSTLMSDVRILSVTYTVQNIGNTMKTAIGWTDLIRVQKPGASQVDGNMVQATAERNQALYASDTYTVTKLITIPQHVFGYYELTITLDLLDDVKELYGGEQNNYWKHHRHIHITQVPLPILSITTNTSNIPRRSESGDVLLMTYTVTNTDGSELTMASWIDGLYIYDISGASRQQVLHAGIRVGHVLQNQRLPIGNQYSSTVNIDIPHGVDGDYFIYIVIDINNKLQIPRENPFHTAIPLLIQEGPLPDLTTTLAFIGESWQSGEAVDILFEVNNIGNSSTDVLWYDSLYLSEDTLVDPFDITLKTVIHHRALNKDEHYSKEVEVSIPFDLAAPSYYIIMESNFDQRLFESDYSNNKAVQVVNIYNSPAVDLVTWNVEPSDTQVTYKDVVTFKWDIANNGSFPAIGYKCDTVYLSRNPVWEITDTIVIEPGCERFSLSAKDGTSDLKSYNARAPIPPVAEGIYSAIVRSRNNVHDYNIENNIATGIKNVTISPPSIQMATTKTFQVTENSELVLKVIDIPIGIALLVQLETSYQNAYHMLYMKKGQPPKQYDYDSASAQRSTETQYVITANTKSSDYYLLMETIGFGIASYSLTIEVKEAKFEITSVYPERVTPVGTVTLRLDGMLFGHKLHACIQKGSSISSRICSDEVFRFGSSVVYATFNVTDAGTGVYSIYLEDLDTGSVADLMSTLFMIQDTPGKLSVDATMPGTLRAGAEGLVRLNLQNIGYNDIDTPIMALQLTGDSAKLRMVDTDVLIPPMTFYPFIPYVEGQPITVIPPRANRQLQLYIQSSSAARASLRIREVGEAQLKGYIITMKNVLRSPTIKKKLWNTIWQNVNHCLGPDMKSMKKRIISILEVVNKKSTVRYGLVEVINQLSLIADGRMGASTLFQYADLLDRESTSAQPLTYSRKYSTALSVRQRKGPMGKGWIVPLLETRLLIRRSGDILLEKERVLYLFQLNENSYSSASLPGESIFEQEGYYIYVARDGLFYTFKKETGRLEAYGVSGTDDVIQIGYTNNRASKLFDSAGRQITIRYNNDKLIQSIHLQNGVGLNLGQAFYSYNAEHLLESVRIGSNVSTYEYNIKGDLSMIQYSTNARQEVTYHGTTGWISQVSLFQQDIFMGSTNFHLDCSGLLQVTTQPENITSTFLFGFGGALVEHKSGTSLPLTVKHDPITDSEEFYVGDEIVATRSYNPDTRIYTQTDANGDALNLMLNEDGDTLEASTSLGVLYENNITDGLLASVTFPDGSSENFEHDNSGKIKKRILRDNTEVTYEFANNDDLVRKTLNKGSSFYIYDSNHRITEIQGTYGTTKIQYDTNNQPIKVVYPDGTELSYTYNDKFMRTRLSTNNGYDVQYNYDNNNRLASISDGAGKTLSVFTYDSKGNLNKRTTGSGVYTNYTLEDTTLRLKSLEILQPDDSSIASFEYKHDSRGYLVSTKTPNGMWKYKYDSEGQLITWESPFGHREDITYDANLNRVTKKSKGMTTQSYERNNLGQVIGYGKNVHFKFDMNGNLMERTNTQGPNKELEFFSFDQEGHITITENNGIRCEFRYNSFGSNSKKTCSDGSTTKYLIDPFGPFGANIISQSVNGDTNFMYYANDLGLVAEKDSETGDIQYFLYDGDGSVVVTSNDVGSIAGGYSYDPFGIQIKGPANTNKFGYLAQLGITKFLEVPNMYYMRARIYDAEHGRFLSPDPRGPLGNSRNTYMYAKNNPYSYKDPTGEFVHIVGGTIIGGITGALANAGGQALAIGLGGGSWSDFSWSDVGGAAVGGAITGAAVTSGAIIGGLAGTAVAAGGGFLGGAAGSVTSDALGGNSINIGDAVTSGLINAPAALVPWTMLGYKGKGATSFGSKFMIPPKLKTVLDPFRATGKTLWKSLGVGSTVGELASKLGDLLTDLPSVDDIKDWGEDLKDWYDDLSDDVSDWWDQTKDDVGDWWDDFSDDLSDWWDDFSDDVSDWWDKFNDDLSDWGDDINDWWQDWIRSKDPNDIIGPTGYGDGNFIAAGIKMDYKIRFENDENATAPAQKVTIRCPLDDDLNPTTFRLGSFGFGDFVLNLEYGSPIFQQIVNVSAETGTFVYFQAGIDILNKEGYWLFQSIDPETGLPPTDPTIGFLPPNNKSTGSGEGFVNFRIEQKENILDGSRIDAQASIIFDENAPIDTPPIYNTIDRTEPNVSLSINSELTDANGIFVNLVTEDTGSGSKEVDIYTVSAIGLVQLLLSGVNESVVSLPLDAGVSHKIVVSAIDYVGNEKHLDAMEYTEIFYTVACKNNCSGNGHCQISGQCLCIDDFHGDDCSSNSSILDPPILDAHADIGAEDHLIHLQLSARLGGVQSTEVSLSVKLSGYPQGSTFSKGLSNNGSWTLLQSDFGDVDMVPTKDISGLFNITMVAILTNDGESTSRTGSLPLTITPVTDVPILNVIVSCYEQDQTIALQITASTSDLDGSEQVTVRLEDIPDFVLVTGAVVNEGSTFLTPGDHSLAIIGKFEEFSLNVTAIASELETDEQRMVYKSVTVKRCETPVSSANIDICEHFTVFLCILISMVTSWNLRNTLTF